ncbi:MAG: class I SAM-dependent methyltransferase [Deltaproteobacteria bacterium]|nr:class I SAM-dependent methyltransferase [Deltaproteobacteria bacterium]MBW1960271.1 class I SAM-dependent methyltransferase [Deltaproteobacteria bacterium]MBW2150316.1 class I SAM-dependent methyltransferase [Deltaproteobacteria bacterium]
MLTPWDTNITPPEVMEFIANTPPGRALDLGCGTGTNAITLARHGWQVTGVDFSYKAIYAARRKAAKAGLSIDFRLTDVTALKELIAVYDFALDIGCLFALNDVERKRYAAGLFRLVRPGGCYMVYAWLPRLWRGKIRGITPEEMAALFVPVFEQTQIVVGQERGHKTAWYWFKKR